MPQQTWPEGQSHACWHPKDTGRKPVQPVVFGAQLHVPTTVPPEMPVGLKQQSFDLRSHTPVPHVGATYAEQLPPDDEPLPLPLLLPDEEPDEPELEDEPDEDPDEVLPPDDALPEEELPELLALPEDELPEEELPEELLAEVPEEVPLPDDDEPLAEESSTVASRALPESIGIEASTVPPRVARQYLPPRGEVAHVSPAGQSVLEAQSW